MAPDVSSRKAPAADQAPKMKKTKLATSVESSRPSTPTVGADTFHSTKKAPNSGIASDGTETQQCKHCKNFVPKEGFTIHSKQCLRDKKEQRRQKEAALQAEKEKAAKQDAEGDMAMEDTITVKPRGLFDGSKDDDSVLATPLSAGLSKKKSDALLADGEGNAKKTKKRKADDTPIIGEGSSKPPTKKQKKKEEASKPKPPKPKGPVDVEKQCGVLMENGHMCARSLTCKSHAMGAKRAVPGRSARYDVLLAQYQKKNQAKQQKAAIASNAPLVDDFDSQTGPVDSDEEKEAVMAAISRSNPRPLIERPVVSVRARYAHIRMKDMLSNALGGDRGSKLFSLKPVDDGSTMLAPHSADPTRRPSGFNMQQHLRGGSISAGMS